MAQRKITCVTNISLQTIPIMVSSIDLANVVSGSDVAWNKEGALSIPPGSQVDVESVRLQDGQIVQLKNMNMISTTVR